MSTPVSGAAAYCTAAQFVTWYDWRPFAQLLSDTDTPLANSAAVVASATLAAFLEAAGGTIEMACTVGGRYSPTDLAALTGNSAQRLSKLNADVAAEEIYRRRASQGVPPLPQFQEAAEILKALADGERIWGLQEVMDAGNLEDIIEDAATVENRALVSYRARRLFGTRNNRIDP